MKQNKNAFRPAITGPCNASYADPVFMPICAAEWPRLLAVAFIYPA